MEFSLGKKTKQMPNLTSFSHNFPKSELLDPDRRTVYVFQRRFGISNFFGLSLLLLEAGNSSINSFLNYE